MIRLGSDCLIFSGVQPATALLAELEQAPDLIPRHRPAAIANPGIWAPESRLALELQKILVKHFEDASEALSRYSAAILPRVS
jgi:hypothetical protein